jgi:fatty-acid desaturase
MVLLVTGITLLFIVAGGSKAIQDTLAHHYSSSVFNDPYFNELFWNPKKSWMNKYPIENGILNTRKEKFLGSTTVFVAFTDAWHLFQLLHINSLIAGTLLTGMYCTEWWVIIPFVVLYRTIFEVNYRWTLRI